MSRLVFTLLLVVSLVAPGLTAGSALAAPPAAPLMQTPTIGIDPNPLGTDPPTRYTASKSASFEILINNASRNDAQYRLRYDDQVNPVQTLYDWETCGSVTDPDATIWDNCSGRISTSNLLDGEYTLSLRINDNGTIEATAPDFVWFVDAVDPTLTITDGPGNASGSSTYINQDAVFTFNGLDAAPTSGAKYQCRLDSDSSSNWQDCNTPHTILIGNLAHGEHDLDVRVIDRAQNTSPVRNYIWRVDKTRPTVGISAPPASPLPETSSGPIAFTFTGQDSAQNPESGLQGFECTLLSGSTPISGPLSCGAAPSPSNYNLPIPGSVTDGTYTLSVVAVDKAGNKSQTPATRNIIIDKTAPTTNLVTTGLPTTTNRLSLDFTFSGIDNRPHSVTFECKVDNGSWDDDCASPYTANAASNGSHTFLVRAVDKVGNKTDPPRSFTWLVDKDAPTLQVSSPDTSPVYTKEPDITFRYTSGDIPGDSPLQITCTLNGVVERCDGTEKTYTSLIEGTSTFTLTVKDAAGNTAEKGFIIIADYTEPQTTLTGVQASPSNNPRPNFAFVGNDNLSAVNRIEFECSIDLQDWVPCESGIAPPGFPALGSGMHTFQVRAIDEVGNFDTTPASFVWLIDVDAPNTTLSHNQGEIPPLFSSSTSATFNFSGADTPAGPISFECQIDNGSWNACTSPRTFTGLVNKSYTFRVRARDQAGNLDPSPEEHQWTVDTVPPPAPSITLPVSGTLGNNLSMTFTGTDSGPGTTRFQCTVSTSSQTDTWQNCTSAYVPQNLPDGIYWLKVRMVDQAGNISPPSSARRFILDKTPPDTSVTADIGAPVGFPTFTREITANFSFTATKSRANENLTFTCKLDTNAPTTCTSPQSLPGLSAGRHTFTLSAADDAGNSEAGGPEVFTWTVDTQFPTTVLVPVSPPLYLNNPQPIIRFRGEDLEEAPGVPGSGVVAFDCELDGHPMSPCVIADASGNASFTPAAPLADGTHELKLFAIDAVGHKDTTPTVYSWTQDTAVPETTNLVRTPPDAVTTTQVFTLTFDFGGTEPVTPTFECKLGDAAWSACTSPLVTAPLDNGSHTFQVRAVDVAGNADDSPLTDTWMVDRAGPVVTITGRPNAATNLPTANFTFTANDNGGSGFASAECRIDNGAWESCSTLSASYADLAEGQHTFHVRATDQLGNVGAAITYSWTVDQTPPDTLFVGTLPTTITVQHITLAFTGTDALTQSQITFECSLDNGPFESCLSPRTFPGLTNGPHNLRVRAVDGAKNADPSPVRHEWVVEVPDPVRQVHLPLVKK